MKTLEGRVIGHGQEDQTGRAYILVEGTDAKVHFIYYEDGIEAARHQGLMRVNSSVRLRKRIVLGKGQLIVEDLGDAEKLLSDKIYMHRRAQALIKAGAFSDDATRWGGWLGRYNTKLHAELKALEGTMHQPDQPHAKYGRR